MILRLFYTHIEKGEDNFWKGQLGEAKQYQLRLPVSQMTSELENLAFLILINDKFLSLSYIWYVSPWKIMPKEINLIDANQS